MAYVHGSSFNSFVPAATGQIISFIRNPTKYKVNQYYQLVKSPNPIGVYYKLAPDTSVRLVTDAEHTWADGNSRKKGNVDTERFDTTEFQCIRRNYGTTIGWMTRDVSSRNGLNLLLANTMMVRNRLMVNRTQRVITLLEDSTKWPTNNTATASTLGGGFWDTGSSSNPVIKRTLLNACLNIHLQTNGMVADLDNEEDNGLMMILSPAAAIKIANTAEMHAYLSNSPFALAQLVGGKRGQNALWGLPETIYGVKLIVENAIRVNEREAADGTQATTNRTFIKGDNSAVIVARPGGLDGQIGAPSFSTVQLYYYDKEAQLQTFDDAEDELSRVHVQENTKEVLAAGPSGFLIQNLFS